MSKEFFGEAFQILEKFAPAIASAFISPAAGIGTSFVMSLLHAAFDVKVGDSESLPQKILSDPDVGKKLGELNKKLVTEYPLYSSLINKTCDEIKN